MKILVLSQSFLLLWVQGVSSKPVPEADIHPEEWSQKESQYLSSRVRRSIPDIDAVNPAYIDAEAGLDQEVAVDRQKAISPFVLTDHLNNFFRGQKSAKNEPKNPQRTPHGERVSSLREDEAVVNGGLPSDEQEECYRQQNLEPPGSVGSLERKWTLGEMPIMDVAQGPQTTYVRSDDWRRAMLRNHMKTKTEDKGEVYSLYSNPERGSKENVFRVKLNTSDEFSIPESVYKPVNVEAQFPVYDEDIDFHPDPLQGILDDKYWLDPQQQEAVIRKYIDLAANNMMPPDLQVVKRSALKTAEEVKSVKSQLGVKEAADGKCPCVEVVACKDCSKGKDIKKNYTASVETSINDEGVSYGRKLLWINDENDELSDFQNERDSYSQEIREPLWSDDSEIEDSRFDDGIQRHSNRKLLSLEIGDIGDEDDETGEDKGVLSAERDEKLEIGRRILWYVEEEEVNYDDEEDDKQKVFERGGQIPNENVPGIESYKIKSSFENHLSDVQNKVGNSAFEGNDFKKNTLADIIENKNPAFELSNKPPGFYTSNKLANVLQKPKQKKPKVPKDKENEIDPQREFEILRNETFRNASRELPNGKKGKLRFTSKGRRSYPEISIMKPPPVVPLFQTADDVGGSSNTGENKTVSNSSKTIPQTNLSVNATADGGNITTAETSVRTTTAEMKSTSPKFKSDEEESLDAKVASNIVESVISESEKGSVLGHNLGLCRRNESLVNVNFGRIVPETEKIFKLVSDCVMQKMKDHLATKSCILLDVELLEFLKWMVLDGESFKDYKQKMRKYYEYVPTSPNVTTTQSSVSSPQMICEPDQSFVSNISIADIQ